MPKIDPPALHFQERGALFLGVMQRDVSLLAAMPSPLDLPQDSPAARYMGWRLALVPAPLGFTAGERRTRLVAAALDERADRKPGHELPAR
jgi:hypothetical protein